MQKKENNKDYSEITEIKTEEQTAGSLKRLMTNTDKLLTRLTRQ